MGKESKVSLPSQIELVNQAISDLVYRQGIPLDIIRGCLDSSGEEEKLRDFKEVLIYNEQKYWRKELGNETIKMSPILDNVTPEVLKNAEEMGCNLLGIPDLRKYIKKEDLDRMTVPEFLDNVEKQLPGWHHYESLTKDQKRDRLVWRNLKEWFWKSVKKGEIDFPDFSGRWLLVETIPKPKYGDKYASSKITDELGLEDRFSVTWNNISGAINSTEGNILSAIGLPVTSSKVRMLEAIEWNLLANREGWGKTNTYEWTNTESRVDGGSSRVIVGGPGNSNDAYTRWYWPDASDGVLGFRLAVELSGT